MSVILNVQVILIGIVQMVSTRVPGISDGNNNNNKTNEEKQYAQNFRITWGA